MLKNIFTKRKIIFSVSLVLLIGMIGFVEKKSSEKTVNNVIIKVQDEYGSHFVDENDIDRIITSNNTNIIRGKYFEEVNLKLMEKNIEQNRFVENAEVYKDHKGNILIDVIQYKPIARIVQQDGPHAYIGDKGNILPVSEKFTARVVIVDGENANRMLGVDYRKTEEAIAFVELIKKMNEDPFLKAQISQITFKKNGDIEMRPQVGDEVIIFGTSEDMELKFKKIKIFYKDIVQLKGYNKYKTVNLKYKEQIICE